ncbi:hypothetical protein I4U23_000224 [Adineta vaga]|nr:hypothetical protein I4U23_000224 [Adineta vaga]
MSVTTLCIRGENIQKTDNSMSTYLPFGEYVNYALYYVAQMVINIQEIKTNFNTQHHDEKEKLIQLNERLNYVVDHVKQLELQNEEYTTKLAAFQQESINMYSFSTEFNEHYNQLEANLLTINEKKLNYQFESELFQMHSNTYQQLTQVINESNNKQQIKLQEELNQSSSTLNVLRTSYSELQNTIETYHSERNNTLQEYLKTTYDWSHSKKQINELKINIQILKNQHVFYKNIHSYISTNLFVNEVFDVKQFWNFNWEKMIANIRHDYELLYANIYRETNYYYEKKMEEVQIAFEKIELEQKTYYQEIERAFIASMQRRFQLEYEELQQAYIYEKNLQIKLEANASNLETEYESIKIQNGEKFEEQSKDLHCLQQNVLNMMNNIEEMRERKINLESELIIYLNLLEYDTISKPVIIDSPPVSQTTTTVKTFTIKNYKKEWISLECPLDNTYICLTNHSTNISMNISGWKLKRRVDAKKEFEYILPDGIHLPAGGTLRIYSKLGNDAAQLSSNYEMISSSSHQKIISDNLLSWDIGDNIDTRLLNDKEDEKASYVQTFASEEIIADNQQ